MKWDLRAVTSVDVCGDEGFRIKEGKKLTLWNQRVDGQYHIARGKIPGVKPGLKQEVSIYETLFKFR